MSAFLYQPQIPPLKRVIDMEKEVERLRAEIAALLRQAQEQDAADDAVLGSRRGDALPDERHRREERLATILAAQQRLEEHARAAAERQRRQEAEAERQRTGQPRRGREPGPVDETPDPKAQTNFTDPALKIMKTANKGWDYCGNAQLVVEGACQIILSCDVVAAANDKEQAVPLARAALANLEQAGIARPQDAAGQVLPLLDLLDSGYYSERATRELEELGLDPYLATERQRHQASLLSGETGAAPPTAKEQMTAKLRTTLGRAVYALRKGIVEPVFGQIKGVRGFRRFLLRGLAKVRGEWRLVCLTHNLLKLWRYGCAATIL